MLSGENNGNGWGLGNEAEQEAKMTEDTTFAPTEELIDLHNQETFQTMFDQMGVIERELRRGNREQAVAKLANSLESLSYAAGVISRLVDEVIVNSEEE